MLLQKIKTLFFREEFTEDKRLKNLKTNFNTLRFKEKPLEINHKNHKGKDIISSITFSKDSIIVVPTIKKGKDFTNLYHFMKNANEKQQQKLWKMVIKETDKMLKKYKNIWINIHGLSDYYLHIRIDSKPKYYEKSELQHILSNEKVSELYCKYLKKKSKKKSVKSIIKKKVKRNIRKNKYI